MTTAAELKELEEARQQDHHELLVEDPSIAPLMDQLNEQVARRIDHARGEVEATREIARLAYKLRMLGVEQSVLATAVKRLDPHDGQAKSISRQMLNNMILKHEERCAKATQAGGGVNVEALL